jgi:membrane-bound lytic murein transglycosylase D
MSDDFDELVGPFDDAVIRELARKGRPVPVPAPAPAPLPPEASVQPPSLPEPPAAPPPAEPLVVYDLPVVRNARVEAYLELFRTVRRKGFERGLVRSKVYQRRMREILAEEGIPQDLYYLALIESAFNPYAYSRARAMGVWQFIEGTGKLYGLRKDWWSDERRHLESSTRAAARHLRDLHQEFGDWPLAMAAYNCGAGRVRRELQRRPGADFWSLPLPTQTKNYVPAIMAAIIIAKDPEAHGFAVDYLPPVEYDVATVEGSTSLDVVADCAGVTVEEVRSLNPQLLRWCTPPVEAPYPVLLPAGTGERFRQQYALIPPEKRITWKRYQIVRGDTFSAIARRFGTTVDAITRLNRTTATAMLRVGDYLVIPLGADPSALSREETVKVASYVKPANPGAPPTKVTYRVRPGDTLWYVAQRHGVTVDELKRWNPSFGDGILHAGDYLTVHSRQADQAVGSPAPPRPVTYQVKKGDSLWSIARQFERDIDELCRANGFTHDSLIQPGDTITIPGSDRL